MKSTPVYRALMLAIEAKRLDLGIAMATVDDVAGLQDGYYAKMIYPDTPSGRCAQWATVQLVIQALFGEGFAFQISGGSGVMPGAARIDKGASHKYLEFRHWRHVDHFRKLGKSGAKALHDSRTPAQRAVAARKAAKARWRKAKKAKRQGERHQRENATKRQEQEERAT